MALEDAARLSADRALVNLPAGRARRAVLDAACVVGELPAGDGVGSLEREFRAFARDVGLDLVAREPRAEGEHGALQRSAPAQSCGHEPEMVRFRPFLLQLGVAEPPAAAQLDLGDAIDEIGPLAERDMPLDDLHRPAGLDDDAVARLGDRAGRAGNGRMDDLDGLLADLPDGQHIAVARHGGVERDQRLSLRIRRPVGPGPAFDGDGREVFAQEAVDQNDARPLGQKRHPGFPVRPGRPEALARERAQTRIFPRLDPVSREAARGEGLEGALPLAR